MAKLKTLAGISAEIRKLRVNSEKKETVHVFIPEPKIYLNGFHNLGSIPSYLHSVKFLRTQALMSSVSLSIYFLKTRGLYNCVKNLLYGKV